MTRLRVLLYANLHEERLGASYLRAFRALNLEVHAVDAVEERRALSGWLRNRVGHRMSIRSLALRRYGSNLLNRRFISAVEETRPHVVFVLTGDFLMPESIRAAQRTGAKVALYSPDNPLPPHYASRPESLLTAAECDLFLVWGEGLARVLVDQGVRGACFLPFAWDPDSFPYRYDRGTMQHDVAFIGGWSREREELLDDVGRHFRLKIWGPDYWGTRTRRASVSRGCWQGRALSSRDAAAVMQTTRVNLNIVRDQHYVNGSPDGVIMRTFEAPGAGAFLLSTFTPTAARLFAEGHCGAFFRDTATCIVAVEHFLVSDSDRNKITANAHEEVSTRHRYTHRVREVLSLLGLPL